MSETARAAAVPLCMAIARSAAFSAGTFVDAVPDHGHVASAGAKRLDKYLLLIGRQAAENRAARRQFGQMVRVEFRNVGSRQELLGWHARLARDRGDGVWIIARQQTELDAGGGKCRQSTRRIISQLF